MQRHRDHLTPGMILETRFGQHRGECVLVLRVAANGSWALVRTVRDGRRRKSNHTETRRVRAGRLLAQSIVVKEA